MVLPYNAQVHSMFGMTEKNRSGPQRRKFPPCLPKFTPLPKRFFSQDNPKDSICPVSLCIIRMKPKNHVFRVVLLINQKDYEHYTAEGFGCKLFLS